MQNTVGSPDRVIVVPEVARDCLTLDTQMRALSVVGEHYGQKLTISQEGGQKKSK